MKLALLLALALTGQVGGNQSVGVVLNGYQIPVVGHDDGHKVNWTEATQDWGGHPPTSAPRTPAEPAPAGWYTIHVNGSPTVVKGYVDASNRLVWRFADQAGGARPNPASISALDPRANGVDFQSLAPGVQASDPASKAEVETVMAEGSTAADDLGRVPLPDVIGLGLNWPKIVSYAFVALSLLVAFLGGLAFVSILFYRGIKRAKR